MAPSNTAVNKAGEKLRHWYLFADEEGLAYPEDAVRTMLAFRALFPDPLTRVVMSMRSFMASEGVDIEVAQRLKRAQTILDKLGRIPEMKLARMHDIGGCRAIVPAGRFDVIAGIRRRIDRSVNEVVREYDYVSEPKRSGYRGIHVVVERHGRLIEIQLRTEPQHRWAEFVEQLGARTGHPLKDGRGPDELLDYLRLGASILAMQEQNRDVPDAAWAEWGRLSDAVAPLLAAQQEDE